MKRFHGWSNIFLSFVKCTLAADGDPIFGAQLVHNTLQMRSSDANESALRTGREKLANRSLEPNLGSWVVNRRLSTVRDTAQASDAGSMLRSESLQQLSEQTYRGFFAPTKSFWTV